MNLRWLRWGSAGLFVLAITGLCVPGPLFYKRFPVAYICVLFLSLAMSVINRETYISESEVKSLSGSPLSEFQKLRAAMVSRFFGIFLLGIVAYFFYGTLQLEKRSHTFPQTEGQVVSVDKRGKYSKRSYSIAYKVSGVRYAERESMVMSFHRLSLGDRVVVHYNPRKPEEFLLDSPDFSKEKGLWMDIGVAVCLVWAFMEFWNYQVRKAHGIRVEPLPPGRMMRRFQRLRMRPRKNKI